MLTINFRSGNDEEVTLLHEKLAELASLMEEAKVAKTQNEVKKQAKLDSEKVAAEQIRNAASKGLKRPTAGKWT